MNKEELEQAFNNTTDSAVDLLKENVELKKKYLIMKENAETLAKRTDKAINILELSSQNKGICTQTGTDTIQSALSILKGDDK